MPVPFLILTHELRMLFRTRRVLALLGLYLSIGVLGGFGYVKMAQVGRDAALEMAIEQGASAEEAQQALDAAADSMRTEALDFAAGMQDGQEVAPSLGTSLVLPIFLWCSLAFLPLLILFTSFDHVSSELANRSLRYSTLRASRAEILFGKTAAHLLVFCVLSAVCSTTLLVMAAALIDDFDIAASVPGLLRVWVLLLPYAACYLAISTFASCSTPRPFFALLLALGITVALRFTGGIGTLFSPDGPLAWLRVLRFASPAHYHDGMWLAGWTAPALSSAAYCGFALGFMFFALTALRMRDL